MDKAIIYVLPYVTKPAFDEMEGEFVEAGYSEVGSLKLTCGGKYNPPVYIRRVT